MIKSLHAVNFRRHTELDLRFDDDRQLILISGANGTGKSSILEAITFALWGEGRHGRRNLDNMVRRGAELEGMSVELVFTMGEETYRVHRRRDGRAVTAVLYANDIPLVEGPQAVTAEISSLLGMDAAGFRLAVIAQQKDLDGLASLRPAERAQMITRLLRLDALTAARNAATARFRSERDLAAALRGEEPSAFDVEIQSIDAEITSAEIELRRAREAIAALDVSILAHTGVEKAWSEAARKVARIEGSLEQLRSRRTRLEEESKGLVIPDVELPDFDISAVTLEVASLEREITRGEGIESALRQRNTAQEELQTVRGRLTLVRPQLQELRDAAPSGTLEESAQVATDIVTFEGRYESLRLELGSLQGRVAGIEQRLANAEGLSGACDTCGQDVPEEHLEAHRSTLTTELTGLRERVEAVKTEGREVSEALKAARTRSGELLQEQERAAAQATEIERLTAEIADLERRERTYAAQVERIDVTPVDMDRLYARKAELALLVSRGDDHARQVRLRDAALTRARELQTEITSLGEETAELEAALERARPGEDLTNRYQERETALLSRAEEEELLRHWGEELARVRERRAGALARRTAAVELAERRRTHNEHAVHAAAAARLLADVSERLATQIRPSLEGAISALLLTMSEGRFSAVRLSDEYNITVEDDGKFRPLSELSGGEMDLVALAVRLALSQVVSERHGSGGAGFLILDECFASQDATRRQSILGALRTLRDVYSQIFLISHVENIEDAADMVIEVATDESRSETEVTVS